VINKQPFSSVCSQTYDEVTASVPVCNTATMTQLVGA